MQGRFIRIEAASAGIQGHAATFEARCVRVEEYSETFDGGSATLIAT
jgi:hypothetical protein